MAEIISPFGCAYASTDKRGYSSKTFLVRYYIFSADYGNEFGLMIIVVILIGTINDVYYIIHKQMCVYLLFILDVN